MGELDKLIPSDRQISVASRHNLRIHDSFPPMGTPRRVSEVAPSAWSALSFEDRLDKTAQSENIEDRRGEDPWNDAKTVLYTDVDTPASRTNNKPSDNLSLRDMTRSSARDVYADEGYN